MLLYTDKCYAPTLLKNIGNIDSMLTSNEDKDVSIVENVGNVAIVSVHGDVVIHSGLSVASQLKYDIADVDTLNTAIATIKADESVDSVLFWFHTYGGTADGLHTAWNNIAELNQDKLCIAFCDSVMASAGYLLASACPIIASTSDSTIGSIGCVIHSGTEDNEVIIASGEFKAASNGEVKTDSQRAYLQNMVDQEARRFWDKANTHRTLNTELSKGGVYRFEDQLTLGLVDLHVRELREIVSALVK